MNFKKLKCGKDRIRRNYSQIKTNVALPELISIQTESFKKFQEEGIAQVFDEINPIVDFSKRYELKFVDYRFEKPHQSIADAKVNNMHYAAPLIAVVEIKVLNDNSFYSSSQTDNTGEAIRTEIFLGDFPLMTPWGTFVINGDERVVVTQIIRSAGAFYSRKEDKNTKELLLNGEIIPTRGAWLQFETSYKKFKKTAVNEDLRGTKQKVYYAKVDRKKKIYLTTFLKALGFTLAQMRKLFCNDWILTYNTIGAESADVSNPIAGVDDALTEVFRKIRPEDTPSASAGEALLTGMFFDHKRYDLAEVGRHKINTKLDVFKRLRSLVDHYVYAEDITNVLTGEVLVKKGDIVSEENANLIKANRKYSSIKYVQYYENLLSSKEYPHYAKPVENFIAGYYAEKLDLAEEDYGRAKVARGSFVSEIDAATGEVVKSGWDSYELATPDTEKLTDAELQEMRMLWEKAQGDLSGGEEELLMAKATVEGLIERGHDINEKTVELERILVSKIQSPFDEEEKVNSVIALIGTVMDSDEDSLKVLEISDVLAAIGYFLNLHDDIGHIDDIDHLGNRRLRLVGELLQDQFRIALSKIKKNAANRSNIAQSASSNDESLTEEERHHNNLLNVAASFVSSKQIASVVRDFFGTSQLCQFMDQVNPLSELTHKRRVSALGEGGLTRERAGFEVRDVHTTHYGRICPIETPEGQNIGLIGSLATYANVDKYGFIETPYLRVEHRADGAYITDEVVYFSAEKEEKYHISPSNIAVDDNRKILDEEVIARYQGETNKFSVDVIDFVDVSPQQIISITTACIPFLEHDDATRALMGANMQRQAIPLIKAEAPLVGTGIETKAAHDVGVAVIAPFDGVVKYVDAKVIKIVNKAGTEEKEIKLNKFLRSNSATLNNQKPIVVTGEEFKKGDILADGPAMDRGELALGRNVVVAFMTWDGYNFEDAVIMSERLVQDDVYTSIHIDKHDVEFMNTRDGAEIMTPDVPESRAAKENLDEHGIVRIGAEVKAGDVLIGKTTPKGQVDLKPEEALSRALFEEKAKDVRNTSLKVPHGGGGIVHSIDIFDSKRSKNDDPNKIYPNLGPSVLKKVRVYIAQKRKISEGDKMSGRHGNKGVISRIVPQEDMPYLADGTPIDIMLNPQGIPSRMNIGQVLEVHLGYAAKKLGLYIATPAFDGVSGDDLENIMREAGMVNEDGVVDGKFTLYDGRTGEPFDNKINVGVMYMIKLSHMVDDKIHARSEGPYALKTQQPLGGKAQNGGQRFGEMEVWALEGYGASHTLREMLTIKSDDMVGRKSAMEAIIHGKKLPEPGVPESFRVLIKELQALCLNVELIDEEGNNVANKSIVPQLELEADVRRRQNYKKKMKEESARREAEAAEQAAAEEAGDDLAEEEAE